MKKLFVIACALFALCTTASAQFMNAGGNAGGNGQGMSQDVESTFGTLRFSYSSMNIVSEYDGKKEGGFEEMNALSLEWTNAHNIMASQPLYLEYGAGLQWSFWSDEERNGDGDKYSQSVNFLAVKVPVSVVYDLAIPQTSFSIMPYAGLNLATYLLGQAETSYDSSEYSDSHTSSCFSDDDTEGEPWNRVVLGWQVGARVNFGKYFAGIGYEGPLTNFLKKTYDGEKYRVYSNQLNITLGWKF